MTYPNERDCKHGNLRRSCEICGLESDLSATRQQLLAAQSSNEYLVESVKHLQGQLARYANPIVRQIVADVDGVDYMLQIISSDPTEGGLFVRVELPFKRGRVAKEGAREALEKAIATASDNFDKTIQMSDLKSMLAELDQSPRRERSRAGDVL